MSDNSDVTLIIGLCASFVMSIITGALMWYIIDEPGFKGFFQRKSATTTPDGSTSSGPSGTTSSPSGTTSGPSGGTTSRGPARDWQCIQAKTDNNNCQWIKVRRTAEGIIECAGPNDFCDWSPTEAACKQVKKKTAIACPTSADAKPWCLSASSLFSGGSNDCSARA